MIATLRTILFWIVFLILTVPIVIGALIASLIGRRSLRRLTLTWAQMHNAVARVCLGIRPVSEDRVRMPGPVLYAARHESAYEPVALLPILGEAPAVVLKEELTRIPFWGRAALRYGVIPVNREGSARALRAMLTQARRALAEDRSILIFPEGTRVSPGDAPLLRPGFAGLYRALGLPVVPIAIDSGTIWPRDRFAKRSGVVRFRFGAAIPPGLPRDEIEARVRAAIGALRDETAGLARATENPRD